MDKILSLLILLWLMRRKRNEKQRKVRRYKTRPVFRDRNVYGEMILMKQVYEHDPEIFFKSFRMNVQQFDYLLDRLGPFIARTRDFYVDSISPRQRLAMSLR